MNNGARVHCVRRSMVWRRNERAWVITVLQRCRYLLELERCLSDGWEITDQRWAYDRETFFKQHFRVEYEMVGEIAVIDPWADHPQRSWRANIGRDTIQPHYIPVLQGCPYGGLSEELLVRSARSVWQLKGTLTFSTNFLSIVLPRKIGTLIATCIIKHKHWGTKHRNVQ